jgi:hypothetical protein
VFEGGRCAHRRNPKSQSAEERKNSKENQIPKLRIFILILILGFWIFFFWTVGSAAVRNIGSGTDRRGASFSPAIFHYAGPRREPVVRSPGFSRNKVAFLEEKAASA